MLLCACKEEIIDNSALSTFCNILEILFYETLFLVQPIYSPIISHETLRIGSNFQICLIIH